MNDKKNSKTKTEERKLVVDGKEVALKTREEREAELKTQKAELKALLDKGEIDGVEYNQRLIELMVPDKDMKVKVKTPWRIKTLIVVCFTLAVAVVLIVVAIQVNWRYYFQSTLTASAVPDFREEYTSSEQDGPVQIAIDGYESGEYKGRRIEIAHKDYYDITATVASVYDYWGFGDYETLVPRDVCLVWGSTKEAFLNQRIKISQFDRGCSFEGFDENIDESELKTYRNVFGINDIVITTFSNNHLIASTAEIRDKILGLKARDKVRIIGYLVKVHYNEITLDSSTKRDDGANGACEVIFVTDIKVQSGSSNK